MSAKLNREPVVIDRSLVVGNLLFATPRDRCSYIGTSIRDRPLWLEEHAGSWRRIEDVQREAVSPAMTEPVATASEVPRHTEAAMNEADRPETETTPLKVARRKPSCSRGRQIKKQKLSAEGAKAHRMLSPERMRIVLDSLRKRPILYDAASKAGIHCKTLEYWIKNSAAGRDGYDVEWRAETWKLHEHCRDAVEDAHDRLIMVVWPIAMGGVIYKTDQSLVDLGYQGTDAYLRDESGNPVVETIRKPNMKMLRLLLELLYPDEFGKSRKIDVPQKGGVLVIGASPKKPKNSAATAASIRVRKWKAAWRLIEKAKS
jgi:hypothetical protein